MKELEEALEPRRIIKIFGSIFLIAVLGIALVAGIRIANNTVNTVEATSRDHTWFISSLEQIKSLEIQITETKTALDTHKKEVETRWVSRSDDRVETQRLTHSLLALTERRADLIRNYNSAAEMTEASVLGDLPKKVELVLGQ